VSTTLPFHLIGISHHTADVALRERISLAPDEITDWLAHEREAGRSLVVLATCNRFELYWWGDEDQERRLRAFAARRGAALPPGIIYQRDGAKAVRHLFAVAAGLDSQVFGESEILGQLRRAYEMARSAGTSTWALDAVFAAALAAGRRVRHETPIGRHPASVGSAALAHARLCWGDSLVGRHVLLLGAGEAAEVVLRALESEPVGPVTLLNRTGERADALAGSCRARAGDWRELPTALADADVVCVTTSAPHPVVTAATLEAAIAARGGRPIVVLDLAVPRNVEPAARDIPGVRLFDLDDLRLQHCPVTDGIAPAIDQAERIIREELAQFRRALRSRAAAPHLAELHRIGERLATEEADRALAELGTLSDEQREVVRRMASRLTRRLLYPASRTIRERGF